MADMAQTKNRKVFLDKLRVAAICAVVLLHTVTGVRDHTDMSFYPEINRIFLAVLDLVTWSVPVFLMISGYLFLNPERTFTWRQMLFKYCRRILLALFLFGIPFAVLELAAVEQTIDVSTIVRAVWRVICGKSWSHMWYLYLIFFLYLITPVLRWILRWMPAGVLWAVLAFLAAGRSLSVYVKSIAEADAVWLENLPVLPDFSIYLFYYLCGYLFVCKKKNKARIPREVLLTLTVLLATGMVLSRLLITERQIEMAYDYPFTVILSLLVFALMKDVGQYSEQDCCNAERWHRLGELCFAVYLIHPVFVNLAYKFLHVTPLSYPIWWSLPLFWLVIMMLSAISAWVLYRIPLLRRYVL